MDQHNLTFIKRLFLLLSITVLFTGCLSDEQVKSTNRQANAEATIVVKKLSKEEFELKIKDLLEKRSKRPEVPDFDLEFKDLFKELNSLAVEMPDDFDFNFKEDEFLEGHSIQRKTKALQCLNTFSQFQHFMHRVHEVLKELAEEHQDALSDSKETDDKPRSRETDVSINKDIDDNDDNSTDDSRDTDTTTAAPDSNEDSRENNTVTDNTNSQEIYSMSTDGTVRTKRDAEVEGFDLGEVLDKLEDDDTECLAGFFSKGDEKFLCRHFAHRSSGVFGRILAAGFECGDYLMGDDDDDDKDDHLDESHQMAILKLFKDKESKEVDEDDIKKLLRLAPDVIDDDVLEDMSEELFKQNLHRLGRLAAGQTANPRLRYALRNRLDDLDLSKLSPAELRNIGPGLLSLSLTQIQTLNVKLLLDSDLDDLLDTDDSKEQDTKEVDSGKDDDDDDKEDDVKLAIGLRMKEVFRQSGFQRHQIGRAMHYLHHDLDFVHSVEPDDLLDALDDVRDIDYDFDDARSVLHRLTQSSRFPPVSSLSGYNLTHMGKLMRGMDLELLAAINKKALEDALDDISDVDFDDFQAHQLLENMGYTDDDKEYENFDVPKVKRLGRLFRGMPAEGVVKMKQDVIEEALDDLDDMDLNDALKNTIMEKVRHNDKISTKFLGLKHFAEVISLDDLNDFDDDDIKIHFNVSSHVHWRLSQAALLVQRYKLTKRVGRFRPSNLGEMKQVALGLLPDDLDDIIKKPDDVFDIAEELKDIQDDLTSGQIDELLENFNELNDFDSKKVVIDDAAAMQGAHVLAYLSSDVFDKLEFTKAGKLAFISQVAKMSTHKMSREHVQFLAKKVLEMLDDTDSAESPNEKPVDRESRRLRSLGQMALGLTPAQISVFNGMAIIDNLDILRNLALAKAQAKAILEKIEDINKNWRCDVNILARVGPLLPHHDDPFDDDCDETHREGQLSALLGVVKSLEKRREEIQERLDEGFTKENDDATDDIGEKRLVDAVVFVATQKLNVRKRRAVPGNSGTLTCEILLRLGNSARLVELQLLKTMPNEELKRCLPQVGAVSGWSKEVLTVLADKLKLIYGNVSTWPAKTVAAAGSVIAGLSPSEIQELNGLNGVDVMYNIGRHRKLSTDQLKAGFRRWMQLNKKRDVSHITAGEFSSVSEFVCGLEASEISQLRDVTFKRSLNTIGQSTSCTPEQRQAYINKALSVYGQVSQWNPPMVADMGYLLGALSGDHIKMLSSKQLSLISPKIIQAFPKDGVAAMSTAQLLSFSTNQANAVTHAQYAALTAEQQKVVGSKATLNFTKKDDKSGGNRGSGNKLTTSHWGFLTLMTALLASILM
ncbi:hypothetical protein BsWGS_05942 [Bradybaena similaris]